MKNDKRRQKLLNLLSRTGATSLMNNTKWQRLVWLLEDVPASYRVKLLVEDDVSEWYDGFVRDRPNNYFEIANVGPVIFLEIEWLEIDAVHKWRFGQKTLLQDRDSSAEVEAILARLRIPHNYEDGIFRIWGHLLQSDISLPDEADG